MQHLDQEQPAKAIERNDSDKVVDRCDQRAGSNRRIDVDLFKEQRNAGADGTGNQHALCLMKNPQEAEDAVSEAVVAAYENIHKLKKEEAFRSWIFTILTNKCKKRLKKALKEEPGREEELPEQPVVPDYDLAMDVRKAFFVLSEEEQILVGLSIFGGYCSQEIGEMMRLNPNTVRSKRSRALKKMECVLGSYGETEHGRKE